MAIEAFRLNGNVQHQNAKKPGICPALAVHKAFYS